MEYKIISQRDGPRSYRGDPVEESKRLWREKMRAFEEKITAVLNSGGSTVGGVYFTESQFSETIPHQAVMVPVAPAAAPAAAPAGGKRMTRKLRR